MQIPASYETEMALLGNMMVDVQSATFALQSGLNESDFHLPANKTLFKAIQTIHGAHQVIDASLVIDTLREHNDEYLYFRTDHHWTQLGAYYVYQNFWRKRESNPMNCPILIL